MNEDTFVNMTTIGKLYGKTSHAVGRELQECGFREGKRATQKALGSRMAVIRRDPQHPTWISVLWNKAKVCELLEDFGWRRLNEEKTTNNEGDFLT